MASTASASSLNNWVKHKIHSSSSPDLNSLCSNSMLNIPNTKPKLKCYLQTPVLKIPKQSPAYQLSTTVFNPTIKNPKEKFQSLSPVSDKSATQQWNFLQKAAALVLDTVENVLLTQERQHPLPKTADPRVQIAGNFAPVPEQPVKHSLPITGRIPKCIEGVYVRNGANPLHKPIAGHHFFDGDGMIHSVQIINGSASYACRFTETQRFVQEKSIGRPIFPKAIGELHGHSGIARLLLFYARGLFGLVDPSKGIGVANAGLVYFNNRLLAMSEDDTPYHVEITKTGDLKTVGRFDFNGQLESTMIAHPKVDPVSGELFALSYDVVQKPYLKYFHFSPNGKKSPEIEIPLPQPTMIHDFSITDKFVVIPDQQVVFKLSELINGGSPVIYDKKKMSRFGILDKNAKSASGTKWIEAPDCFCFLLNSTMNAIE